jgi:hypothetical protein
VSPLCKSTKIRRYSYICNALSGHQNFAESTEEIPPLSKEEAKEKLEELRRKAAEKKAKQALIDKEEAKKNEVRLP